MQLSLQHFILDILLRREQNIFVTSLEDLFLPYKQTFIRLWQPLTKVGLHRHTKLHNTYIMPCNPHVILYFIKDIEFYNLLQFYTSLFFSHLYMCIFPFSLFH